MQRRSFLKTVSAALMVPCVHLRREVDRESLMLAFCDEPEMSRWDLDRPFSIGSLTYATDARHMVRAELSNRIDCGERRFRESWSPQIDATTETHHCSFPAPALTACRWGSPGVKQQRRG